MDRLVSMSGSNSSASFVAQASGLSSPAPIGTGRWCDTTRTRNRSDLDTRRSLSISVAWRVTESSPSRAEVKLLLHDLLGFRAVDRPAVDANVDKVKTVALPLCGCYEYDSRSGKHRE